MRILNRLTCAAALLALCVQPLCARTILFLGSSFTYGAHTAVQHYRPETVHDLIGPDARGDTFGGVPAIFKQFTLEAGLNWWAARAWNTGLPTRSSWRRSASPGTLW
jgi:hypothetical protein